MRIRAAFINENKLTRFLLQIFLWLISRICNFKVASYVLCKRWHILLDRNNAKSAALAQSESDSLGFDVSSGIALVSFLRSFILSYFPFFVCCYTNFLLAIFRIYMTDCGKKKKADFFTIGIGFSVACCKYWNKLAIINFLSLMHKKL